MIKNLCSTKLNFTICIVSVLEIEVLIICRTSKLSDTQRTVAVISNVNLDCIALTIDCDALLICLVFGNCVGMITNIIKCIVDRLIFDCSIRLIGNSLNFRIAFLDGVSEISTLECLTLKCLLTCKLDITCCIVSICKLNCLCILVCFCSQVTLTVILNSYSKLVNCGIVSDTLAAVIYFTNFVLMCTFICLRISNIGECELAFCIRRYCFLSNMRFIRYIDQFKTERLVIRIIVRKLVIALCTRETNRCAGIIGICERSSVTI